MRAHGQVLFLVLAGNFALTIGFYWSYTFYSSHPFLCAFQYPFWSRERDTDLCRLVEGGDYNIDTGSRT